MHLAGLELVDFRSFSKARAELHPTGATVIVGPNGAGKTTLLEAAGYLGLGRSFRGAPREALVRRGATRAFIRGQFTESGRAVLVEAELGVEGKAHTQINRQPARSRRDLAAAVPVTVFSPTDLIIVQGGPGARRDLLDDALAMLDPEAAPLFDKVERILRQRSALLRQTGGRLSPETMSTLEVWDARLAEAGEALAKGREELVSQLLPLTEDAAAALGSTEVGVAYRRSWEGNLHAALLDHRADDVRRGMTGVGPHRDDLVITLEGREARNQASQGEQRCLALALKLAVHLLVTKRRDAPPILLLDDVFSELDPTRSRALLAELPVGQTLVTTAVPLPAGVEVARVIDVTDLAGTTS